MKTRLVIGTISIFLGTIIILDSLPRISGHLIVEQSGFSLVSFFGAVLFMSGLALFLLEARGRSKEEGGLERNIIRTRRFEKSIRKHDHKMIQKAIDKIGTGLAHEEFLKHERAWSIRTSKGGRILYEKQGEKIVLLDYDPHHYETAYRH